MAIEQGLFELLGADAPLKALVGTDKNGTTKMYWDQAPKGQQVSLPYLVLSRVATGDTYTMQGPIPTRDAVFQVDCYDTAYYDSRAISKAVRKVLQSYKGTLSDSDATVVQAVFTEKDWDMPYEEGAKGFVFRALLEFRVWYVES